MYLVGKQAGARLLQSNIFPKHSRVAKAVDQSVCVFRATRLCRQMRLVVCAFLWRMSCACAGRAARVLICVSEWVVDVYGYCKKPQICDIHGGISFPGYSQHLAALFKQVLEDPAWWCCRMKVYVLWAGTVWTSSCLPSPASSWLEGVFPCIYFLWGCNDGLQTSTGSSGSGEVSDGWDELGCGDPNVALAWAAGFVLLKDVGLPLKTLPVSTERWLSGCEQLTLGVRFSYGFLLKGTNNNWVGTTFDHSQNLSGFWTSDLQVKGFVPSSVAGELSLLLSSNCRYSPVFSNCLLLKPSMQLLCVTLLSRVDFPHCIFVS